MIVRNFLFHRVSPQRDKLWDPMDVDLFDKCIKHITNHYTLFTIEDIILQSKHKATKPLATVSFDDGYKDNIEYATPILKKYSCSASFYVVTNCIDNNIPTWTYLLDYSFQNTQKLKWDINNISLPAHLQNTVWTNTQERIAYGGHLKKYVKTLPGIKQKEITSSISLQFNDVQMPRIMMDWDDIRQLKNEGFVVGSHSVTHPMLGALEDEKDVYNELSESAKKIEKEIGVFPITISYPIGSYTAKTIELSKKAGYKMGLATKQRFYNTDSDAVFEIPRTELYNESWFKTRTRINGSLEAFKSLIRGRK